MRPECDFEAQAQNGGEKGCEVVKFGSGNGMYWDKGWKLMEESVG